MQTETLVGLISGLGGAVIGFAGALGGAWIQQSYGARNAKQERLEQRALTSGEAAINELLQLSQLVDEAIMEVFLTRIGSGGLVITPGVPRSR